MATKNKVKGAAQSGPAKEKTKQAFAAAKPVDAKKGKSGEAAAAEADRPKRALGLRGAAPWAARHAAKHAAEARKRAAEPPPPGSARATIRTPAGVDEIKAKIGELHNATEKIRSLRKNLGKSFFEIGLILRDIQQRQLYAAKHFQSFEAFVEREVDLGKTTALRLVKLVGIFQKEAALEMGMDKAMEALVHLEGGEAAKPASETRLPAAKPVLPTQTKGPIVGRLRRCASRFPSRAGWWRRGCARRCRSTGGASPRRACLFRASSRCGSSRGADRRSSGRSRGRGPCRRASS